MAVYAQQEFSLYTTGSMANLNYSPETGSNKAGFGNLTGIGYTYFFSERWGVSSGVEVALYNNKYTLPSASGVNQENDGTNDFELIYHLSNYEEKQRALLLNIPVMLRYQYPLCSNGMNLYVALGGKAGIPVKANYKARTEELETFGFFPQYDLTLREPEFMGFGTYNNVQSDNDLLLNTAIFASAEAGVKWPLANKLFLYTGIYADYGLNNINGNLRLNPTPEYAAIVNKVIPLSFGVKIALAFRITK
jgi:hypothetical protein